MSACPQYEPLLLDEAAGELPAPEAARLADHRRGCQTCREEGAALAEVLALVRLPPPDAAERKALDGLAAATAHALGRRAAARIGLGLGGALAAAAALLLVLPLTRPPAAAQAGVAAAAAWQAPDPEALWADADLFGDEEAAATSSVASSSATPTAASTAADAALAALDF